MIELCSAPYGSHPNKETTLEAEGVTNISLSHQDAYVKYLHLERQSLFLYLTPYLII